MENKNKKKRIRKFVREQGGNDAVNFFDWLVQYWDDNDVFLDINNQFMGLLSKKDGGYHALYVFPEHRNKGIATRLFDDGLIRVPTKTMIDIAFKHGLLKHYSGNYYYHEKYPNCLFNVKYGDYVFSKNGTCHFNYFQWNSSLKTFEYDDRDFIGELDDAISWMEVVDDR